jgi:hypothetical protein
LIGVFLTGAAPNTVTPPSSGLDFSTTASFNQTSYSNLLVQQPFVIGTGSTSGSVVKSFIVPVGATRLFLGLWDDYQNEDNEGSLTVTTTQMPQIYLVQ